MATFVLIHGSWHGAWCWRQVIPLLEEAGHRVVAPDLPGHGADATPLDQVTLASYTDRVSEVLDAQPEPAILVGHSHGGVVITQSAEYRPNRVRSLVYLCAYLPRNGESLFQLAQHPSSQFILQNLQVDETTGIATLRPQAIRELFYGDCSDEDAAWAQGMLNPEPMASPMTPVQVSEMNFGRIPRFYIECTRDRATAPELQKAMYTASPCLKVFSLATDHSPFLSTPGQLADMLITVAQMQPVKA